MSDRRRKYLWFILIAVLSPAVTAQWYSTADLPDVRWCPACCANSGYVYTIGGEKMGIGRNNVWYSEILEDGSLTNPWLSTTGLPGGRMYHGCFVHNNYIFVLGGLGSGSYRNDVWSAEIQADGSIGSWISTTDLPSPRSGFNMAVCNGYIYVIGGYNGSTDLTEVVYAKINDDGTIETWESTTSMPAARRCCRCFAYNDYLYITGGHSSSLTYYANIWFAQSNPDGTINSWTSTTPLPAVSGLHGCCVEDGDVYITGGQCLTSYYNSASTAGIQSSGPLDPWISFPSIPEVRSGHGYCSYDGYLYIIGGTNWSGNLQSVRYAHTTSVGIASGEYQTSSTTQVHQISPNPFHGSTEINYSLSEPAHVIIRVYDCSGRMIRNLTDGEMDAGEHSVFWNCTDESRDDVPSGVYYYSLNIDSSVFTGCMVKLE